MQEDTKDNFQDSAKGRATSIGKRTLYILIGLFTVSVLINTLQYKEVKRLNYKIKDQFEQIKMYRDEKSREAIFNNTDTDDIWEPETKEYVKKSADIEASRENAIAIQDTDKGYSIKMPAKLEETDYFYVTVTTLEDRRAYYQRPIDNGKRCTGVCGTLIDPGDLSLVEKQFDILREVSDCEYTGDLDELASNFIMFYAGAGHKDNVKLLKNENLGICGLVYYGLDGYAAGFSVYDYEAAFLKGDTLVFINIPVFPENTFEEIDRLLYSYGIADGGCLEECYTYKVVSDNINDEYIHPDIERLMDYYNEIISSFKLE